MHKTVVIGSVIIDVYRLVDTMKKWKFGCKHKRKGNCCLDGQENGRLVWLKITWQTLL